MFPYWCLMLIYGHRSWKGSLNCVGFYILRGDCLLKATIQRKISCLKCQQKKLLDFVKLPYSTGTVGSYCHVTVRQYSDVLSLLTSEFNSYER